MHHHFLLVGETLAIGLHRQAKHHQRGFLERRDRAPLGGERRVVDRHGWRRAEQLVLQRLGGRDDRQRRPSIARRASMPGISSRLISLVPSKIRLTRASR